MTTKTRWLRATFTLAVAGGLLACATTHRVRRPDVPLEERGAVEMRQLMGLYQESLQAGDLDKAEEVLVELEEGLRGADPHLRSHPDFGDMKANAKKARTALLALHMKDLSTRRTAAYEEATAMARRIEADLDPGAIESLENQLEVLQSLTQEGDEYRHISQFLEYDQAWKEQIAGLMTFHTSMKKVRAASDAVSQPITDGQKSIDAADLAAEVPEQLDHLARAAGAFRACRERSQTIDLSNEFALRTPLGRLSAEQVRTECESREQKTVARLERGRWLESVKQRIEPLGDTHRALTNAATAKERLEAAHRGIEAYGRCSTELAELGQHPGFDNDETFYTPFGHLSLGAIREKCDSTGKSLAQKVPQIEWRIKIDAVAHRATDAARTAAEARRAGSAAEKAEKLGLAMGGFTECSAQASDLTRDRNADPRARIESDLGSLTASELARQCGKRQQIISPHYKKALKTAKRMERMEKLRAERAARMEKLRAERAARMEKLRAERAARAERKRAERQRRKRRRSPT